MQHVQLCLRDIGAIFGPLLQQFKIISCMKGVVGVNCWTAGRLILSANSLAAGSLIDPVYRGRGRVGVPTRHNFVYNFSPPPLIILLHFSTTVSHFLPNTLFSTLNIQVKVFVLLCKMFLDTFSSRYI